MRQKSTVISTLITIVFTIELCTAAIMMNNIHNSNTEQSPVVDSVSEPFKTDSASNKSSEGITSESNSEKKTSDKKSRKSKESSDKQASIEMTETDKQDTQKTVSRKPDQKKSASKKKTSETAPVSKKRQWIPAEYRIVHHKEVGHYETIEKYKCPKGCGTFDNYADAAAHQQWHIAQQREIDPDFQCDGRFTPKAWYQKVYVVDQEAYDEKVLVKKGYWK